MIRWPLRALALLSLLPGSALAQGAADPCTPIPSAARSAGQISIPAVSLDLPGAGMTLSPSTVRGLEAQFQPRDALVSLNAVRAYAGADAERVSQMMQARVVELGVFRSALPDGPAPIQGGRWAGLYSDGTTDLLILAEPIADWPPQGVLLSLDDLTSFSKLLSKFAVVVTTYGGKGVVQAVCDGRAASVARFVPPTPKVQPVVGPLGCTDIATSPNERTVQPEAVPRLSLELAGTAGQWPAPIQAALQSQIRDMASQIVLGTLSAYAATPDEVGRRYAGRLVEQPGWRAAYPSGIRPMLGGGQAGLFSNGQIDVLMLAFPGAAFPPAAMPLTADGRTRLRAFASDKSQTHGTVLVRYEGRGLVRAACAGQLDAVFRPE